MALGKTAKRLEAVRDQLLRAREGAGGSSAALERDFSGLLVEIDDMLRQWFPERSRVEDVCTQAESLIRSAPDVSRLTARMGEAISELHAVREEFEALDDPGVSVCGCQRIDQWSQELKGVAERASSGRDRSWNGEIDRISVLVKRQSEAARKMAEAQDLTRRIGPGTKTAALEVELGNFRDLFLRQEPSPESMESFERVLAPVRIIANTPPQPPPPPPPIFRELRSLMSEARRWLDALGWHREALQVLEDSVTRAEASSPDASGLDSLPKEVREFVIQLRFQARQEQDDKLYKLHTDFRYYEEACGPDRKLAAVIETLKPDVEHADPVSFVEWRENFGAARDGFDGLAKAGAAKLEGLLRKKLEAASAQLSIIRDRNLLDEVRRSCDAVRARLDQLGSSAGPTAALADLRIADELKDEIEKLDRQSADDLESYSRSRDLATARKNELEVLAQSTGMSLLVIRVLNAPPQASLARCRKLLDEFVADLDAASVDFLRACSAKSVEDYNFCVAAAAVLKKIPGAPALAVAMPGPADEPKSAADQRAEYVALRTEFTTLLEQQAAALAAKLHEIKITLEGWQGDRPDDLREARDLIDDIASGAYDTEPDLTERVWGLREILARCEDFLHRMERDRREAEEKLQRIRQRWRRFSERDLKIYYPEYSTRITGLLMGVPAAPRDWKSVSRQLDEIASILAPLEREGMKRAAAEIEDAFRILSKSLAHASPEKKREAQPLLDSLSGTLTFPDSDTRRRLRTLRDDVRSQEEKV